MTVTTDLTLQQVTPTATGAQRDDGQVTPTEETTTGDPKKARVIFSDEQQRAIDALVGARLASARTTWEADQQARLAQATADAKRQALEEAGDHKGLLDEIRVELATERAARAQERADRVRAELDASRARVASRHFGNQGLTSDEIADLTERLKGATEAELSADAASLVKLVGPRRAPETQSGQQGGGGKSLNLADQHIQRTYGERPAPKG